MQDYSCRSVVQAPLCEYKLWQCRKVAHCEHLLLAFNPLAEQILKLVSMLCASGLYGLRHFISESLVMHSKLIYALLEAANLISLLGVQQMLSFPMWHMLLCVRMIPH